MIKKSTIDRVFEAARVEEVIGDYVSLKRSGSNFKGLSPFTDERTPSFMVSPAKQIWKDFSSGKGGSVVTFLMEHEHFSYPEAIKHLAKKYGIEIEETEQTEEEKKEADERESMYLVNTFANTYFQNQLQRTEVGKAIGLSYFKERGFTDETLKQFELGYSPDQWEAFTQTALGKGYKLEFLEKTGLTVVKSGSDGLPAKQFDRFKGRVMFPIHSMSGRVLGFGGRILDNTKKAAKYLNSPESEVYHKSKVLYGLYQAKKSIAKEDVCYLVEGYADVIQFHQSGITNTVASSGTALTPDQIRLIRRLTKNIIVLYDGDAAGARASLRGIDLILEQDMHVKVCSFPEGDDPDSFAKKHTTDEIKEFLASNAKDFIHYKAEILMADAQNDPVKKAGVIRDMMHSIAKIPDDIQQELYLRACAKLMDISENALYSTLAQIKAKEEKDNRRQNKSDAAAKPLQVVKNDAVDTRKIDPQEKLEYNIIKLLLLYGDMEGKFVDYLLKKNEDEELELEESVEHIKVYEKIYKDIQEDESEFANEKFRVLYSFVIKEYEQKQKLVVKELIHDADPEITADLTSILMQNDHYKLHDWERHGIFVKDISQLEEKEVIQTILNLRTRLLKKKVDALLQEMMNDRENQHVDILEVIRDYKKLQVLIAHKLDNVIRP